MPLLCTDFLKKVTIFMPLKSCNLSLENFSYTFCQTTHVDNTEEQGDKGKMISFSGNSITYFISVVPGGTTKIGTRLKVKIFKTLMCISILDFCFL